ncbi:hypothetical protein Tco_1141836 [Tanacetum coccineum]
MSTPIDFSAFIMNGLNISNLTQETLLGPAFRLLKGIRKNYAELDYDFKECYKALSEKLDWENPEGGDYPFDLSKPLPLIMHGHPNDLSVEVEAAFDLVVYVVYVIVKTPPCGYLRSLLMTLAASTSTDKSLKDFDDLMSTPIDFSGYILNGLKIENLTLEILLGPAFRLLKGTRSNYAELEYDFEECYKALSEKLDWENPEGGDYPFDLSKPLPLTTRGNRQRVSFEFFINNDLKYLQGGISTMTYTTSTTKIKAAQYDLPGIESY